MTPIDKNDEKGKTTFRRLILSKQLYLHGLEHSRQSSVLDKMIAVHNFHNAIEIILRAIILHYEIRPEKGLNLTFEDMIKDIDKHQVFITDGLKLSYRQEISILNKERNMVQHHADEPPSSTMEKWRVFSKSFLVKTFKEYFDISFDNLSAVDFINDGHLCSILRDTEARLDKAEWKDAIIQSKVAFIHASKSIAKYLPHKSSYSSLKSLISRSPNILLGYSSNDLKILKWQFDEIDKVIKEIYNDINEKQFDSAILSSGVNISDLKKFNKIQPVIELALSGNPVVWGGDSCCEEDARWVYNFVSESIIKWQLLGLEPNVSL